MEWDCELDSDLECDCEPESQSDSESEPEPQPVTQPTPRRCSAGPSVEGVVLLPAFFNGVVQNTLVVLQFVVKYAFTALLAVIFRQDNTAMHGSSSARPPDASTAYLLRTVNKLPALRSIQHGIRPAAAAAHAVGLLDKGRGIAEQREFVFDPATQVEVGIDPGGTQAVSATSRVWDERSGHLVTDQLRRWKLTKGYVKQASGLHNSRRDNEPWLAPIKPHLQHLAAASSAGTSLVANLKHITATLATWDAVWEVYLDPKWARQRLRLYGAQDRALEQFYKERHGRAKQLVVFFGAASIGTGGGWGADAVLRACCKVVCMPRGTDQLRGRVVLVDEHRTTRQPGSHTATEIGPSTPPPVNRSKRTNAEQAAEPTQPTEGKADKAKPATQPGRWLDRDCNAALNMQRIVESKWWPLELCYWPDQGALPAKGKEYPGLG
ncbi:hypothetical protein QJQ45_004091 [Haematococcus lacustris]|nr:hypothetical protein QJQ45_004091 [Haematococcus lacustris]